MLYSGPYGDLFYSANYFRFVEYFYKTFDILGLTNFCWDGEAAKHDNLFKVCKSRQIYRRYNICRVGWGGEEGRWTFYAFIDKYMQIGNKRMVTIQTQRN